MKRLESIKITNFKSIGEQTLALGNLNVFIGCNGAGKSNLVEVFKFLREIIQKHLSAYTLRNSIGVQYWGQVFTFNIL